MAKLKTLSPADLQLWAAYSQTVALLPGRSRLVLPPEVLPPAAAPPAAPAPRNSSAPTTARALGIGAPPAGLDKSTWRKFAAGKMRAAARLDLHGHTAARAHHAVQLFIEKAAMAQERCVEIITGNGEVLARELPHWLNAPRLRPLILAVTHPHAANTGALRILLRRAR